ncbi:MAG: 50S ribosomal protein L4 [candidate division WWE3 bacterium]|nr:50S ribosomal protein L4 [candidate division WWE3 bacterium]
MGNILTVPQFNIDGEKMADYTVSVALPEVVNQDLLSQVIRVYQTNQRQGNANAKTRGDVSGGGKKPWKQKHTGRARAGSTRSPIWRHGGVAHGPVAHDYNATIPDKMRTAAFKMALSDKINSSKVAVIAGLPAKIGSRKISTTFGKIVAKSPFTLVISAKTEDTLAKSSRNLADINMKALESFNAYDIISSPWIILSTAAAKKFLN